MRYTITLLKFLPQNCLSYMTGWLARLSLPFPLQKTLNRLFVLAFGIDLGDANRSIEEFASIEDLFTRSLQPQARPILARACSPADGIIAKSLSANGDTAVQAKGKTYSISELVFGKEHSREPKIEASWYSTVYLAPHNYHRVHSPIGGFLIGLRYIPGRLWPVNRAAVGLVDKLFIANERLVFEVESDDFGKVYVVMVGAFNVGRMTTHFWPEFATNSWASLEKQLPQAVIHRKLEDKQRIEAGAELGVFLLGSTVISIFTQLDSKGCHFLATESDIPVRMGQSLFTEPCKN